MEKKSTNRSFGILFSIVFLIITFWPVLNEKSPYYWFLAPSLFFLILGLLNSKLLGPFNSAWVKLGNILGMIIAPVVMSIIFFLIVTPIGLFMRILGKDFVNLKLNKNLKSYWIKRQNVKSMKRQF